MMEYNAQTFRMLGDENRLRIMVLLVDRQLCVGHIQAGLNLEQSNTSKQLNLLRSAEMVCVVKQKQRNYYSISQAFLENCKDLIEILRELKGKQLYKADEKQVLHIHECGCDKGCLCKL